MSPPSGNNENRDKGGNVNMGLVLTTVIETIKVLNDVAERNDMGSPMIITLLTIAQAGGEMPQSQLMDRVGITVGGVSRILTRLGPGSPTVTGLRLVATFDDYQDRRHRIVALTDEGKKLMAVISKRVGKYAAKAFNG